MTVLFALLVLGVLVAKIPSDAEIAARIEDAIRAQLQPTSVTVFVKRPSSLSTTFERVEITISGFNADRLPLAADSPDAPPSDTAGGASPRRRERTIHIIEARLTCTDISVNGLPVRALEWTGSDVYLPWQAVQSGVFQIAAARSVTGCVVVDEKGLTKFLRTLELPITDPEVTINPGECRLRGATRTLIRIPIELTGTLIARDGAVLYLDRSRLRLTVVPVPSLIAKRVLKGLNPLIDLNAALRLPAPLVITSTTQQDGALRFDGALQFPLPETP